MPSDQVSPFEKCATGIKRKELAERFTQYLNTRDTEEHAFPVNLNGAWGTGKTFFVNNWKLLVKDQGHIGIKIDAWESDYLDDPLTIIIAEIIEQLKGRCNDLQFHEQEKKVANALVQLKSALPAIAKALIGIFLGKDAADSIGSIVEAIAKTGIEHQKYEPDLNMGELGLEATRAHIRHKQFIKDFKDEVGKLVDIAQPNKTDKKVFVFIDELDRCRPTYAIEMLETVKHLFDIPNFVFVFSTDTKQLQHSIKAVYGQDFDSHEYLSRFFEQRLTLPEPDFFEFLTAEKMFDSKEFKPLPTLPEIKTPEELRAAVALVCQMNQAQLSLRRAKQICMHIEVTLQSEVLQRSYYSVFHLIGLIIGRALYHDRQDIEDSTPLQKCQLAIKEQTQRSKIEILKVIAFLKGTVNSRPGSPVKLTELINQYDSALGYIKKGHLASQFRIDCNDTHTPQLDAVKKLKLQPIAIKERAYRIDHEQKNNILSTEQLFEVIESLDAIFIEE
ncbi:KAP family P-loop NTPase fold protein [Marinomonas fungiae]|uniref:KAP family P-loop domain n=1 Tax=Marinomonas fungiae TaxID=1137284 RepID=A0A0K6IL07_9GAMM|nr:P-loop NTPase fold protein [Marinomonas fungiae]CUB03761.1 KAP family P-loop domain [Marinomonas fungiae]